MDTKSRNHTSGNLIAILFGFALSIGSLEVVSRFLPSSSYFSVERPIICNDITKLKLKCFVRRSRNIQGRYIKGIAPPFPINAYKKTNDIGQFSDLDFSKFILNTTNKIKILSIGDSLTEGLQISNSQSYHGILNSIRSSESLGLDRQVQSTMMAASALALPDYLKILEFATAQKSLNNAYFVIAINESDFDRSFQKYSGGHIGRFFFSIADGSFEFVPSPITIKGIILRTLLRFSGLFRYLFINIESHSILNRYPLCKLSTCESEVPKENTDTERYLTFKKEMSKKFEDGYMASRYFIESLRKLRESKEQKAKTILLFDAVSRGEIFSPEEDKPNFYASQRSYLISLALKNGFSVIDMTRPFFDDYQENGGTFRFINDSHWNPKAHQLVADEIIQTIIQVEQNNKNRI